MAQDVNGYDIVFSVLSGEQKKIFAGTKSNSFNINPKVKESLTKEDRGTTRKRVIGYDTDFSIDGVMQVAEDLETTKVDRIDIIKMVTDGAEFEFVYGSDTKGDTCYKGKMIITAYSETTDAEGEATYSLSCQGTTKLTPSVNPSL